TVDGGVHFPLTVAEGCIFVLGDNRGISKDSRYPDVGQIDKREVLGKAIFLMYPGTDDGTYPREFDRVGAIQ
ncbi:MAG TPA: signal peptidase I, partial [Clostridiales bacterium]|nr:signal peptidase I [Clostridiales bacterium]